MGTAEFKDINWLAVEHRVAQMKLVLMYRIANGLAPEYLQIDFNHVSKLKSSASSLCIPSVKSTRKATLPTLQLNYGLIFRGKSRI